MRFDHAGLSPWCFNPTRLSAASSRMPWSRWSASSGLARNSILAIVELLEDGGHRVHDLRRPFQGEPDFGVTGVNYAFPEIIDRADLPS
jgi:hypothetical protein